MTIKKADIVKTVMGDLRSGCGVDPDQLFLFPEMKPERMGRARAAEIVESLLEFIKASLTRGEDVQIDGFGKFHVRFKWARKGRNLVTGEPMMLAPRRVVLFRPSRRLRDRMNAAD
jgi:integration host factor subunit alpha